METPRFAPDASAVRDVDTLHLVVFATLAGAALVILVAAFLVLRSARRRRGGDATTVGRGAHRIAAGLEIGLLVALLATFCGFWVAGFRQYAAMRIVPEGAIEVYVTARKWMWSFVSPDGRRDPAVIYVPVGRPVKLSMSSRDVVHNFTAPAFGIQRNVVPGRTTTVWLEAATPGAYPIYGDAGDASMRGQVVALPEDDYQRHLAGEGLPPSGAGAP